MKNKRGVLSAVLTIMIGVTILIIALALAGPVRELVDEARSENTTYGGQGLNCNNETLTDFRQSACLAVDLITPAFIGVLIGLAFIIIGAKVIFDR